MNEYIQCFHWSKNDTKTLKVRINKPFKTLGDAYLYYSKITDNKLVKITQLYDILDYFLIEVKYGNG